MLYINISDISGCEKDIKSIMIIIIIFIIMPIYLNEGWLEYSSFYGMRVDNFAQSIEAHQMDE